MKLAEAPSIPANELADVYRAAVRGELPVVLAPGERPWAEAFAGDVRFLIGEWRVTFFNDCMELDYTENATAPDGRTCDDWCEWDQTGGQGIYCPLDLLTDGDFDALERLIQAARPPANCSESPTVG